MRVTARRLTSLLPGLPASQPGQLVKALCVLYMLCAVEGDVCRRLQRSWRLALPVSFRIATHAAL